jgi:hypothetical protein
MVKFQEKGHKYYTLDGTQELISVSGLMHRFEQPKDWDAIAEKSSKNLKRYKGITKTPLELKAEWEKKRIKGSEAGTMVHKIKEAELLATKIDTKIVESFTDSDFKYALNVQELEDNTVYPELMIYDLGYGICGQSDIVEIKNDYIIIRDHKTDKSIEWYAYDNGYNEPEMLLGPLSHLENCNGNVYSLKMSLYMYLIWKANKGRFKPGKIILNWCPIDRDADGYPILYDANGNIVQEGGQPRILYEKEIEVPYRKKEVMAMLETLPKKTN